MLNQSRWTINKSRLAFTLLLIPVFIAGCNLHATSTPTPDLFATLQASTPLGVSPPAMLETPATPNFIFPTVTVTPTALSSAQTSIPSPSAADQPTGHIVFTCQIFKVQASNQICIMNADGSDYRRLTTDNSRQHYYPSLAPDGKSILYSAFFETNNYEIYEMRLDDGSVKRLTNVLGVENAPEVSPDGSRIVFTRWSPNTDQYQIMLMDRDGGNMENIPRILGWDPTWSPDGKQVLFASDRSGTVQLHTVRVDGKNVKGITNLPSIRGRSDWSPDGQLIVTYSGPSWNRELYIMNADGSNVRQLTPSGGNSQGPSFSPDGKWVAFTAYFDHYGDDHGCEIYIIRVDGTGLRRLTDNDYCDYQPRWGP
jgi:TolB protein